MGAYSTMNITRTDALTVLMGKLLHATDEQLESVLWDMLGRDNLRNFRIVGSYDDDESDRNYKPGDLR